MKNIIQNVLIRCECEVTIKMEKKAAGPGQMCGQVRKARDKTPDLPRDLSSELSFEELRNKFDTSAAVVRREIACNPATHGSATRQVVSGKIFKKCKSATFQIDGATYTIGKFRINRTFTKILHLQWYYLLLSQGFKIGVCRLILIQT